MLFSKVLDAKQGNSMYHFSSLWYDSTGYRTKRVFCHWAAEVARIVLEVIGSLHELFRALLIFYLQLHFCEVITIFVERNIYSRPPKSLLLQSLLALVLNPLVVFKWFIECPKASNFSLIHHAQQQKFNLMPFFYLSSFLLLVIAINSFHEYIDEHDLTDFNGMAPL